MYPLILPWNYCMFAGLLDWALVSGNLGWICWMDLYRASGQKCSKLGKIGSWSLILNGVWLYNTSLYFILVWISDISCILHICTYACVRLHYITFFSSIWKIFISFRMFLQHCFHYTFVHHYFIIISSQLNSFFEW